jgi:hypothetical protein
MLDFIKNNKLALSLGGTVYLLFLYYSLTGNVFCGCKQTETIKSTTVGVHGPAGTHTHK